MTDVYTDSEGRQCDLAVMCLREPGWAASRIAVMLRDIDRLREQLAEYQESVLELAPIVERRDGESFVEAVKRVVAERDAWAESAELACETPDSRCECSGCSLAREQSEVTDE